jgi:hypothetical protein
LVQQVGQVQAVVMERMARTEKFLMHRFQQDPLDHKERLALLAQQDPQDLLVLLAQQDQQVQVLELLAQPAQLEHPVLREVLDQQDLRVQRVPQVALGQLDLPVHKEKLEQLVQQASLKLLS